MTNDKQEVVEYSNPIALAGCEYFFVHFQDGLSLVEAIALCHVNGWAYPEWIRNAIGESMVKLYQDTFINVEQTETHGIKSFINSFPYEDDAIEAARKNYKTAQAKMLKSLKLNVDRESAVDVHKRTSRNRKILELIAHYSDRVGQADFKNDHAVMKALEKALNTDYEQWKQDCLNKKNLSDDINGRPLRAIDVTADCLGMTYKAMEPIWEDYKIVALQEYKDWDDLEEEILQQQSI